MLKTKKVENKEYFYNDDFDEKDSRVIFITNDKHEIFSVNDPKTKQKRQTVEDVSKLACSTTLWINSYNAFCDKLEEIKKQKKTLSCSVVVTNKYLFCFKNAQQYVYSMPTYTLMFEYEFENSTMAAITKKIIGVDANFYYVSKKQYFQLIGNSDLIRLAYVYENDIKAKKPLYHEFKLKQKSGKIRDIVAPNDEIMPILRNVNETLQKIYESRNADFQVAYKHDKNIIDNAEPHANHKYVFKIDLHNFFPSCKRAYVDKYTACLFNDFTVSKQYMIDVFDACILKDNALYIGSPVSGILANTIIAPAVKYIKNMCNKTGISFTVYADDMTFSSDKFICKDTIITLFTKAFTRYNMENDFKLNDKKTYGCSGVQRHITGVAFNDKNEMTCKRSIYKKIRQTLHQLSYGDKSHFNYNKLKGNIAFASMCDHSSKMKNLIHKYKDVVLKYKLINENSTLLIE